MCEELQLKVGLDLKLGTFRFCSVLPLVKDFCETNASLDCGSCDPVIFINGSVCCVRVISDSDVLKTGIFLRNVGIVLLNTGTILALCSILLLR